MKARASKIFISICLIFIPFLSNAAEVDLNGFLTHSVEIKLPPGTNGMAPKLSFDYNSGAGNGIAGQGWSLSGLPAITRDTANGVKYDGTDTFVGSSGRLKAQSDGTYRYEYENYSKVQKFDGTAESPAYWIETRADGTKYYYGNYGDVTSASIYALDDKGDQVPGKIRVWAVSKVEDIHGNYYEVHYGQDNGEYYPEKIIYTLGNGLSKKRTIEFVYDNAVRKDFWANYTQSSKVETRHRLKSISINVNVVTLKFLGLFEIEIWTDKVRSYNIEYSGGTSGIDPSIISKIAELDKDGQEIAVQSFQVQPKREGFINENLWGLDAAGWLDKSDSTQRYVTGDFNGDGKSDLLHTSDTAGDIEILLSTNTGFQSADSWGLNSGVLPGGWLDQSVNSEKTAFPQRFVMGDFNGDNKLDLLHTADFLVNFINNDITSYTNLNSIVLLSNGSGFISMDDWNSSTISLYAGLDTSPYNDGEKFNRFKLGDFDGNGMLDFLQTSYLVTDKLIGLATDSGFISGKNWDLPADKWLDKSDNTQRYIVADFNGDGMTDLLHSSDTGKDEKMVYLSSGSGFVNAGIWGLNPLAWFDHSNRNYRCVVGDFNGDGKMDLLRTTQEDTFKAIKLSTGSSFVDTGDWELNSGVLPKKWLDKTDKTHRFIVADFNGDGKSDLLHTSDASDDKVILLSTGSKFIQPDKFLPETYPSTKFLDKKDGKQRFTTGDFNGDGKTDILHTSDTEADKVVLMSNIASPGAITKITTNIGGVTEITYKDANAFPDAIVPETVSSKIIANSSPRQLVASIKVTDNRADSDLRKYAYIKDYDYKRGKFLTGTPSERKNLYFESITENNRDKELNLITKTVTYYEQDDPWKAGSILLTESRAGNGELVNKVEYTYNDNTLISSAGTHSTRLNRMLTTTSASGIAAYSQSRSFSYDEYGNVTNIIDHSDGTDDIVTSMAYATDEGSGILNRPSEIIKTVDGKIIEGKRFTYEGKNLSGTSAYLDVEARWIDTKYTSDVYGNILTIADSMGRTSTITYDGEYNTFPVVMTNALGEDYRISMTYDPGTGNLKTKIDLNDRETENIYDNKGRLEKVKNAEGDVVKEIDYNDELRGQVNAQYIETKIFDDTGNETGCTKSYYDGLGRVYRNETSAGKIGPSLVYQVEVIEFNEAGLVESKTIPYISGRPDSLKITYKYNAAGQVVEENRPDNVSVKTIYTAVNDSIIVTKRDPNGNTSSAKYDSRGRLVKKNEQGAAQVSYFYDGADRLIRTIDAGGHVTTIEYDSLGRKRSINDPNTGLITYDYDDAGNLIAKSDAIGNTITYSYDIINRLLKTDYPDDTPDVTYIYDEAVSNGKGRVTTIRTDGGEDADDDNETKYSYDSNGNVVKMEQTTGKFCFKFDMEYDTQNRMTALTYPDNTKILREYSEAGYLRAVKQDGGGAYVQYALKLDGVDEFENSIKRVTGNGIDTAIAYNPANMRPVAIESYDRNNKLLEKKTYKYDPAGNIKEITDNTEIAKPYRQTFQYDTLNRLTKAIGEGTYGEQNFRYTPAGNLTKNSHGNLEYNDREHPYAVTGDGEGNSYTYDANGNMITGRAREMKYDAEGRLVSLKKDGTEIQKNSYDHTGHRVIQQRNDGTTIYNIGGLYEIVESPVADRPNMHTKYIYGMEGDLAAQVTTPGATLRSAGFIQEFIYDKGYSGTPIISFLAKKYKKLDRYFTNPRNILKLQHALVLILITALIAAFIKTGIIRRIRRIKRRKGYTRPVWSTAMSLMITIAMTGSLTLTGCEETVPGIEGGESDIAGGNGFPTKGTFYFHPDHIGSISYLTDSNGEVVTRMSYTPYGEKVKNPNSGPDISNSGPDIFHQKYTGQVDDGEEAELLYYNARYYDPKLGRFISADSMIPDATNTQAFNRYMYVQGNPVSFNDPSGNSMADGAASIGASSSDISGVGSYASSGGHRGSSTGYVPLNYSFHPTNHYTQEVGRYGTQCICSAGSRLSNNGHGNEPIDNTNYPDEENLAENDTHRMNFPISSTDYIGTSDKTGSYQNWRSASHTGVDIIAKQGTNVYSTIIGKVIFAGKSGGYGNLVIVEDEDGYQYLMAHLSKILVRKGSSVRRGQRVGLSGWTGNVRPANEDGAHIHFEVRDPGGSPLNLDTGEQLNIIIRADVDRIKRIQRIERRGGV